VCDTFTVCAYEREFVFKRLVRVRLIVCVFLVCVFLPHSVCAWGSSTSGGLPPRKSRGSEGVGRKLS